MTTPSGLSIVVIILLVVLVLLVVAPPLEALIFSLPSGRVKCITEDLRAHSMSVAHYRIIIDGETTSSSHRISVKVSDPKGENVHLEEGVEEGRFAFVAAESGPHNLCFWSPKFDISFASLSVELDWTVGVSARDWPAVAKKDKIQDMENELKKLEESVHLIHEDMLFLREREEEMQKLMETTNSSMGFYGFLSLFLCLTVAGLQLWHLNAHFKREKIF